MLAPPSQAVPLPMRRSPGPAQASPVARDETACLLAIILGLLSVGETRIGHAPQCDGAQAMAEACRKLGAAIERAGDQSWHVHGVGVGGLLSPEGGLDFGGSLAGAVLLMGVVASHGVTAGFDGDPALRACAMMPALAPLMRMGAEIVASAEGVRLPLTLRGAMDAVPVLWRVPDGGPSSPVTPDLVASAVLLAGLNAPGETTVVAPQEAGGEAVRLLRLFGADVATSPEGGGRRIVLQGRPTLRPAIVTLPAETPPASC
ncbi:hypothetical protein [Labrys okinawensis]|uniref:hypothetical protein n=1 Tax=Labrys okinawensis TaxID=346911 RepID=UPI0015E30354|nr:hypothetical protein [Labrys okinawensis]